MNDTQKPTLYLMIGYPGSGKSTFAGKIAEEIGAVRLNSDAMRAAVFGDPSNHHNARSNKLVLGGLKYSILECLKANKSVILDSNCNRYEKRLEMYEFARSCGAHTMLIWIKTPLSVSINRAATREINTYQDNMNEATVRMVAGSLEEPFRDEKVVSIDGTQIFSEQSKSFNSQTTT